MFVLAIILFVIALAMVIVGKSVKTYKGATLNDAYHLKAFALIPLGLGLVFSALSFLTVVSAGEVAVPTTFGSIGQPAGAGIHLKAPWTTYHTISVRTQQYTMVHDQGEGAQNGDDSVGVLGADAATANVDATITYHVDKAHAGELYKTLGGDFVAKIIRPTSRTCIRDPFARVSIVDAATDKRDIVVTQIRKCIETALTPRGLALEDFQLRNISLSAQLQQAVDAKVAAQQSAQQKVFELQKAEADARITTIQAKAKADSQQILACGGTKSTVKDSQGNTVESILPNAIGNCNQAQLTPAFLELQKVQALQNMINSPNHSVLIVPEDFKGLIQTPQP